MKNLKYRSIFGALATAALSVFLFTACEKESDGYGTPQKPDRLSKFKALTYTGSNSTTTSNTGSGTFLGNNSNISFVPPGGATGSETQFAPASGNDNGFTDPMSTESSFVISNGFSFGGGTVSLGGKSYTIDLGFCASSDVFGFSPGQGGSSNEELDVFIGVSGNFDIGQLEDDSEEFPVDLILYVFSYNGGKSIGSFTDFEGGEAGNGAFVIAVEFDKVHQDGKLYFSTSGSVDFAGSSVTLSSIQMAEILESIEGDELGNKSVPLQAFLECGSLNFDEEEDTGSGPM